MLQSRSSDDKFLWSDGEVVIGEAPRGASPPGGRSDSAGYNPYRDGGGRFAPGPHADRDRIERVRSEATQAARGAGHHDHVARGEHEAHLERQAIANEHRALAAGHISSLPTAKLAEYDAVHARIQHEAAARQAHLDEYQQRAAEALVRLHAHPEHEAHEMHDPVDEHEAASEALGRVAGRGEHAETRYELAAGEAHGSYREHAEGAQHELEVLHEHQQRAIAETSAAAREHNHAARRMQRELDQHEERGVAVPEGHSEHDAARAALETLAGHEGSRRADLSSETSTHLEDAVDALREAAHGTAQTVRELSRVTGRPPSLSAKRRGGAEN